MIEWSIEPPPEPLDDFKGDWVVSTPQVAGTFSAVCYNFAVHLSSSDPSLKDVPIGLVASWAAGTPLEAWLPPPSCVSLPGCASKFGHLLDW